MSVRSHKHREHKVPPTDPKWYPVTRGLNRWLNKMARRKDLAVRVLRGNIGAPARYVPNVAEIDFSEALLSKVDPRDVGSEDFVIKYPFLAGGGVHEAAHARWSTFDIPTLHKAYGRRHAQTFMLLEEGRCETQQWDDLTESERDALRSLVLDLVLKDVLPDDGSEPDFDDPRLVLRLMGLIAARARIGIIDTSQPKAARIMQHLRDALGEHFDTFNSLAVEFASTKNDDYYSRKNYVMTLNDVVSRWIAAEDAVIPPPEDGGEDGDSGEDGESGDESDGKGKGKGKSQPDDSDSDSDGSGGDSSDDEGDNDADADGDKGDGDGDEDGEDTTPGDDDEGEAGDGSHTITDKDGDASLGDYASSNIDAGPLADLFDDLAEAAEEAEKVAGSRLKARAGDIRKATASDHRQRREYNKEAMKRWQRR